MVTGPQSVQRGYSKQKTKQFWNLTSLICNFQIPDILFKFFWKRYENPDNYGLELKGQYIQHSARLVTNGDLFCSYSIPLLSGIQLFGLSTTSPTYCMDVQKSVTMIRNTMYGKLPILLTIFPKPSIEDDSTIPQYWVSSSYLCAHYEKHVCSYGETS